MNRREGVVDEGSQKDLDKEVAGNIDGRKLVVTELD